MPILSKTVLRVAGHALGMADIEMTAFRQQPANRDQIFICVGSSK
jgi:hypothetical protein